MTQLILHLIGDYITQSDWMANNKTKSTWAAFCHATIYSLPFAFICPSWTALFVIWFTHLIIDRLRLARYVVYIKNIMLCPHTPRRGEWVYKDGCKYPIPPTQGDVVAANKWRWENCKGTGYPSDTPPFLAVWLLIAADNTLHLAINYISIKYL